MYYLKQRNRIMSDSQPKRAKNRGQKICSSCEEYDDYPEFLQSKTVECREPQNCEGCREIIQAGEYAKYTSEKYVENVKTMYAFFCCELCQRTILSIAAEKIRHGCGWSEAWCHPSDIRSYLRNLGEQLPMLEGSLDECKRQVDELKKPRKRAHKVPVDDFKTLERGDIIRVVGGSGPYYTGDDGERTYLVDRGKYKVLSTDDTGINVYGESGYGYLYMGEICPSKLLASITQAPCKILKVYQPIHRRT